MQLLQWKVKLSILWVALAVGMSAHMLLIVAEPGILEELMEGRIEDMEITSGMLVFFALFWIVPLLMAYLVHVLGDRANRLANAGLGVVMTVMWVWDLVAHSVNEGFSGVWLTLAGMTAASLGIVWHAWKWPKVKDEQPVGEELMPISAGTM
ncbi:MAG: DUF6326 family protein [Acidimicrobiia bacterium]|nr:DUF6326 family protein [Acidimicrobiia bacterium]